MAEPAPAGRRRTGTACGTAAAPSAGCPRRSRPRRCGAASPGGCGSARRPARSGRRGARRGSASCATGSRRRARGRRSRRPTRPRCVTPRSCSHFTLVSPRRNHSSSAKTARVCTFLVVTSGKPAARSKRIWWPKTLRVPVPVRSPFSTPSSRMRVEEVEVGLHAAETTAAAGPRSLRRVDLAADRRRRVPADPDARPPRGRRAPARGRPSAVPCEATYDAGSRSPASHWPMPALRLPVTGSSPIPIPGQKARTSHVRRRWRRRGRGRPRRCSRSPNAAQSGSQRQHGVGVLQQHRRPSRDRCRSSGSRRSRTRRCRSARAIRARSSADTAPERSSGGAAKASRLAGPPRAATSPAPHSCTTSPAVARHSPGLQPGVRAAQGRVAGERQLAARREDPQPVVGARRRWAPAGTSSRTGWSSGRTRAIWSSLSPSASCTTATGLPSRGSAENTSTWLKLRMRLTLVAAGQRASTGTASVCANRTTVKQVRSPRWQVRSS